VISNLENSIYTILGSLGILPTYKGYNYIKDAVILILEDNNKINNVTKILYPILAERYNTTACSIERDIGYAYRAVYNEHRFKKILGYYSSSSKLTNSNFIALLVQKIKLTLIANQSEL